MCPARLQWNICSTAPHRVEYVILDEFSMLGQEAFHWLDRRCRQATGRPEPFGGLSIILVGDSGQLPPVADSALYVPPTEATSQAHREGHMMYRLFELAVVLTKVQRQQAVTDADQYFRDVL